MQETRGDLNLMLADLDVGPRETISNYISKLESKILDLESRVQELEKLNKPNWCDAPEWANYISQDANGDWWWWENKPTYESYLLAWLDLSTKEGKFVLAGEYSKPIDGGKTLEQKPVVK